MTAEQGIELLRTIKTQMNELELTKFNNKILEAVESQRKREERCLSRMVEKHAKGQKLRFK